MQAMSHVLQDSLGHQIAQLGRTRASSDDQVDILATPGPNAPNALLHQRLNHKCPIMQKRPSLQVEIVRSQAASRWLTARSQEAIKWLLSVQSRQSQVIAGKWSSQPGLLRITAAIRNSWTAFQRCWHSGPRRRVTAGSLLAFTAFGRQT